MLGGSFNPAHDGHLAISKIALQCLDLDQVWWLVSPQNPLKNTDGMAPLDARLEQSKKRARHPLIKVTALEDRLGTRFTADTLRALRRRFPQNHFVWLMGADNLAQVDRWVEWNAIFEETPIAVFARPRYSLRALASKAARRYGHYRIMPRQARGLALMKPPCWVFFTSRLMPISSTEIRASSNS